MEGGIKEPTERDIPKKFKVWVKEAFKDDYDKIDVVHEYDRKIDVEGNIAIFEDKFRAMLDKEYVLQHQIEQAKAQEEKQKFEEQQRIREEEAKLLEEWSKTEAEPIRVRSFEIPQDFIRMCCKKISNGCFLVGEGGIGKSFMAINTIKEENIEFVYMNTSISPLALYKFLYKNKTKLVVLDDVQGIFGEEKAIAILKSALWEVNGKRLICWETTSSKLDDVPELFEFTGQIVILANKLNTKNENLSALASRVNYQSIEFTYHEKVQIMKSIIKKPYKGITEVQRKEVLNAIIERTDEADVNFNFRTLIKAYNFYIYKKDKFELLLDSILEKDTEIELIKTLSKRQLKINQQIQIFTKVTGKGRSTYFEKKKALLKSRSPANVDYRALIEDGIKNLAEAGA